MKPEYTDEGWSVNGRPLPDPQDYKRLALSLSRMEAEEVGLRVGVEAPLAQTSEHTRVTSAPETDSSNVPSQKNSGEFPFLLPDKTFAQEGERSSGQNSEQAVSCESREASKVSALPAPLPAGFAEWLDSQADEILEAHAREYDQKNGISSLPAEERTNEEEV